MDATLQKRLTLATMSIATFLAILDTTVVSLAGRKLGVACHTAQPAGWA